MKTRFLLHKRYPFVNNESIFNEKIIINIHRKSSLCAGNLVKTE